MSNMTIAGTRNTLWTKSWSAIDYVMTLLSPFNQREFSISGETGNSLFSKAFYSPWTALATATRKAGDMGETTDAEMDGAVEAMLDFDGADTDCRGIPSDSSTIDKALYAADWLLRVFLVWESANCMRIQQRFTDREQLILKDQQAALHEKGNETQKPYKSQKGHPTSHVLWRAKLLTALVRV